MLAIVRPRERVAGARLVQTPEQKLLAGIRDRETESDARTELDPVAVLDGCALDYPTLHVGTIFGTGILEPVLVLLGDHARVKATDSNVVEPYLVGRMAPHRTGRGAYGINLPRVHSVHP